MGGDSICSSDSSSTDEESIPGQKLLSGSLNSSLFSGDENDLGSKMDNSSVIDGSGLDFGESSPANRWVFSRLDVEERQSHKVYSEIMRSYEELRFRSEGLEEAKSKILSYTPGSWIENVAGMNLSDYDVPKTTSLLLIGPKGSGKSSLVNRISRVLEDDKFASERAQVAYDFYPGDGTYFVQEYMIPRHSGSFCLYDTRSLSDDSSENLNMLQRWMTKGVRNGELIRRKSDSSSLKAQLKCKAKQSSYHPSQIRRINFVVFVVSGLSVLESMDCGDEHMKKSCSQLLAKTFNNPLLSFKDNKPVVVVTHGDLLTLQDRVRVRVHLGKLLGVPPTRQIFDIPESDDSTVALTIVDMLRYCLEHADRNLPSKYGFMSKMYASSLPGYLFLLLVLVLSIAIVNQLLQGANSNSGSSEIHFDWGASRHLWFGLDDE